jgi:hypothetical protein
MLGRWQFNALTALGALALLLALADAGLAVMNRDAQVFVAQRQQYIQQSVALEGLYRDIVKGLAELGTRGNDRALLDILAAQGLSVTVNGSAATAPSGTGSVPGAGRK